MAKREVDIAAMLGAQLSKVSDSDTSDLREIPLDKIRENSENFYPPLTEDEAFALRDSIRANGLLEPLLVVEDGHTYRLISGHNRLRALRDLRGASMGMAYKAALCRVLPAMDADHEITAIIEANRQRKKTPAVLQQEAEALTEAYVRRRKAGEELPGRIRDRVAEAMQVSATKLANLNAIKNGLKLQRFALLWKQGEITESCALEIARLDEKTQQRLAMWLDHEGEPCTLRNVREFSVISRMIDHDCQLAKAPCPNARDMYEAFFRNGNWEGCCGCCASCNRRDTCEEACEFVVQAEPEEVRVEGKLSAPAPQKPWSPKTWQESRDLFSSRLRQEREKTGLDRQAFADKIGEYKATYSAWENGSLPGADRLPKLAVTLGVSTDYLYGLTDDPAPRSAMPQGQLTICGWMPGGVTPTGPGVFAAVLDFGGSTLQQIVRWRDEKWTFFKIDEEVGVPVLWWLRLPPEPEKEADHG